MKNSNDVILSNLINMRCVKGDTSMDWISPQKDIKIKISRENILNSNIEQARYIIKFDICTVLDAPIKSFKINEFDLIKLLDNITMLLYEFDQCAGSSVVVGFNPSDCYMEYPIFVFERVTGQVLSNNNIPENSSLDELRDIKFSLFMQNDIRKTNIKLFNIFVSDSELDDFAYELFFVGLIDITMNPEESMSVDSILERMYGPTFECE